MALGMEESFALGDGVADHELAIDAIGLLTVRAVPCVVRCSKFLGVHRLVPFRRLISPRSKKSSLLPLPLPLTPYLANASSTALRRKTCMGMCVSVLRRFNPSCCSGVRKQATCR